MNLLITSLGYRRLASIKMTLGLSEIDDAFLSDR